MGALLALGSAVAFGVSDFFGGLGSRRGGAFSVTVLAQFAGGMALAAIIWLLPGTPDGTSMAWGVLAGVGGGLGLVCYFRALAIGPMSIVAPMTSALAAAVPLGWALSMGERPGLTALAGIALALVAVAVVTYEGRGRAEPSTVLRSAPFALAGAVGFGIFLLAVPQTAPSSGLWPLLVARGVSAPLILLAGVAMGRVLRAEPGVMRIALISGVLDMVGNALYLWATRQGLLSIAVVLASLTPIPTVLLAAGVLKERLRIQQVAGVLMALAAIVLLAIA